MTTEHDLLWGASEIARVIHRTKHATFRLLELGILPGAKIAGKWCSTRGQLHSYLMNAIAQPRDPLPSVAPQPKAEAPARSIARRKRRPGRPRAHR
jgi:hypothetical protein